MLEISFVPNRISAEESRAATAERLAEQCRETQEALAQRFATERATAQEQFKQQLTAERDAAEHGSDAPETEMARTEGEAAGAISTVSFHLFSVT